MVASVDIDEFPVSMVVLTMGIVSSHVEVWFGTLEVQSLGLS